MRRGGGWKNVLIHTITKWNINIPQNLKGIVLFEFLVITLGENFGKNPWDSDLTKA